MLNGHLSLLRQARQDISSAQWTGFLAGLAKFGGITLSEPNTSGGREVAQMMRNGRPFIPSLRSLLVEGAVGPGTSPGPYRRRPPSHQSSAIL